jgi:Subtilisin inhibitor-like
MNIPASSAGTRHRAAIRHQARVAAFLGAIAVLTAACGSQSGASHPGSTGGAASRPTSSLIISVAAARGDTPRHWTLTCGPRAVGGTLPHPAAACGALARAKDPFAPVPRGIMCSMIDSGPQTASIAGTWHGTRVASAYSRLDSCETARWNKLWKVFSQVNPGGPMIRASGLPPSN